MLMLNESTTQCGTSMLCMWYGMLCVLDYMVAIKIQSVDFTN